MIYNIPLPPVAKARPRLGRHSVYTPEKTKVFENTIRMHAKLQGAQKIVGPLAVSFWFYLQKPKKCKRSYPCVRPDLDNYIKAVMDAMNGVLWDDDGQIVEIWSIKRYAQEKPHIRISVNEVIFKGDE